MNNLVRNNLTAKRLKEINKVREKRKESISGIIFFWGMVAICACIGRISNSDAVYANGNIMRYKHKIASVTRTRNKALLKANKTIEKQSVGAITQEDTIGISENGKKFLKENEGLSRQGYWDTNGITLGWGHKIKSDDPKWLREKNVGDWISKKDADELFEKDMETFINPALRRICCELNDNNVHVNQHMIDAMASLIYNCGEHGFKSTDFYALLKQGKVKQASRILIHTKVACDGHKNRRLKEQKLMNGNYTII